MPKVKRTKSVAPARNMRRGRAPAARASQAIEVAVAGLAHDIRTPLTGVLALAELLLASDLPAQERQWAAAIKGAAEHLAQLTTLVVDTAKAGAAGVVLRAEPFAPRALIDAVTDSLKARAQGKGLRAEVSVARDLPPSVSGDVVRLRSALENLIDNAVKFTERGSVRLAVSATPAARGRLRFTFVVKDSGIGIVAADLERLFQPFTQASDDVARRYGGAGLGLVFVKRIAEAMGGDLVVSSSPGRGSTFRLTVLVERAARAAEPGPRRRTKTPPPLRVLCVEDNPYGRVVLNAVLGELGHQVDFAASGEAAVATISRGGHDAVLMDVSLGGIDGFEATRRIRKLRAPARNIPIIGLSGRTETGDGVLAEAAGMNAYLRKPASPAELHAALAGIAPRTPTRKPKPARVRPAGSTR